MIRCGSFLRGFNCVEVMNWVGSVNRAGVLFCAVLFCRSRARCSRRPSGVHVPTSSSRWVQLLFAVFHRARGFDGASGAALRAACPHVLVFALALGRCSAPIGSRIRACSICCRASRDAKLARIDAAATSISDPRVPSGGVVDGLAKARARSG